MSLSASVRTISARDFVEAVYRGLLDRGSDQAGMNTYSEALTQGLLTAEEVIRHILRSAEFLSRRPEAEMEVIRRCFALAYGRDPTTAESEHVRRIAATIGARGDQGYLRCAIVAFSRFEYATPILVRFTKDDLVQTSIEGLRGQLTLDLADLSVSDQIRNNGAYEKNITRLLRIFVHPGATAIDVGANVGFHTLALCNIVGATGQVYAFEPNSENCRLLLLTKTAGHLENVSVFPLALSDKNGLAYFSPAIGSNGGFMPGDSATLLHPNCSVVPTMRLDDLIKPERLDFMKIDVEGAEYLVLRGARDLVCKHRPLIVAEFSVDMIGRVSGVGGSNYLKFVQSLGYDIVTLGTSGDVEAVNDVDQFMGNWGDHFRIDDLAFVPRERPIDLTRIREAIAGGR